MEPITVSYSELDTFRQCPLKHQLLYRERWTRPLKPDGALARGILWHTVLEIHYRHLQAWQSQRDLDGIRGNLKPEALLQQIWSAKIEPLLYDTRSGAQTDTQALVEWMYKGHVAMWGVDGQWRIIATERLITSPLLDRDGKPSRYTLKAKIDLIVKDIATGGLWVVDHKSGKDLPNKLDLDIDDQFGLYTWLMRQVGRDVMGSLHSAARTYRTKNEAPLDSRFRRTYLNRGKAELTNIALDAFEAARAAYPDDENYRARYSSPDPRSCGWKCDVKEPHLAMRSGVRPHVAMQNAGFAVDKTRH